MNAAYTTGWRWACGATACIDDAAPSEPDTGSSSDSLAGAPKPGIMPFSALALQNGWSNAPFGTRNADAFFDPNSGITHFSGAVAGGTSAVIFTLPNLFWPSVATFIPVDLCGAANGRLIIQTNVEEERLRCPARTERLELWNRGISSRARWTPAWT